MRAGAGNTCLAADREAVGHIRGDCWCRNSACASPPLKGIHNGRSSVPHGEFYHGTLRAVKYAAMRWEL